MAALRRSKTRKIPLTMHDWEARHYVLAAIIVLLAVGMFAYSWS
jgi:hypothetical protein